MKKSVIKLFDKVIVVLLGLLGMFYSCRQVSESGNTNGTNELKSVVTDTETLKPIQNIQDTEADQVEKEDVKLDTNKSVKKRNAGLKKREVIIAIYGMRVETFEEDVKTETIEEE